MPARVERFGPGQSAVRLSPGDFILTHRRGLLPRLIRLAERRRFRGPLRPYAHWSHAAIVVSDAGELVEAEATGVRRSPLSRYRDSEYHLVHLDLAPELGDRASAYADALVGDGFGFLEMAQLGLGLVIGLKAAPGRTRHHVCSTLVALALQAAGENLGTDPETMLPADLARRYGVTP